MCNIFNHCYLYHGYCHYWYIVTSLVPPTPHEIKTIESDIVISLMSLILCHILRHIDKGMKRD